MTAKGWCELCQTSLRVHITIHYRKVIKTYVLFAKDAKLKNKTRS
jgi:hypothetical protein